MTVPPNVKPAFNTVPSHGEPGSGVRQKAQIEPDPADSTPTVRPPPLRLAPPRLPALALVKEPTASPREQLVSISNEAFIEVDRTTPLAPKPPPPLSSVPPDRAVFVRLDGVAAGQALVVPETGLRIGRGPDSDLQIDDDDVSRFHASIQYESGAGFVLYDLDSRNGTSVDGARVSRWILQDGDVVRFGPRSALRFSWVDDKQEQLLHHLYQSSTCDMLTGAHNKKHFEERFEAEIAFATRHKTQLALLMFDLDHFKKVNDTHGHQAGDLVLRHIAATVTTRLRTEDILARYGGEEFAVLLRGVDLAGASRAGERLRHAVSGARPLFQKILIPVTISLGCGVLSECDSKTPESLIAIADRRLYRAKHAGRNRVEHIG